MSTHKIKRSKPSTYHDRIPLENDFEVLQARSSTTNSRNIPLETSRSPLKGRMTWTVGTAWAPDDDDELSLDSSGEWYDEEINAPVCNSRVSHAQEKPTKKKRIRSKISLRPHVVWRNQFRDEYLDEQIRWDGRGDFSRDTRCPDCVARKKDLPNDAEYRCLDCFTPDLVCQECCIKRHRQNPFHIIQHWVATTFVNVSLKSLGLTIHLNHASMRCPLPIDCHQDFKVIHTNGVHDIALSYCGCHRAVPQHIQLLRRGLYPSSQKVVHTCVTFTLLRFLHLLCLCAKTSMHNIYHTLERLRDNAAAKPTTSRYRSLMRTTLQWRHLKLLKRGGRGHAQSGVEGTVDGELAILCPTCAHEGINIPDNWRDAPEDQQFLYRPIVCLDANFRLKNQLVSNYSSDPGLGTGWAYMIRREPYEAYVLSRADDQDPSTCVGFQALAQALTRFSRGLRYTGVGGAFCGRGEMFLLQGVGNMQKGERYANMDYIFASAIQNLNASSIVISYDICCQWYKNLAERMEEHWPENLRLDPTIKMVPLIPKFHEPAHNEKDHQQFSFNLIEGVGQTDGEVPERCWSGHNGLGGSTKTQGPGSRHDILDDHFSFWNWKKYCSMGITLIRKFKAAVGERNRQTEAHRGFSNGITPATLSKWGEMCDVWDAAPYPKTCANPYETAGAKITEARVKEELANEERSSSQTRVHATGPSEFVSIGLDIEDTQRRLRKLVNERKGVPKNLQDDTVKNQRALLTTKIQYWEHIRSAYIPGIMQLQAESSSGGPVNWSDSPDPEEIELWLPSQIPTNQRSSSCTQGLSGIEDKLRTAQCHDALNALRRALRLKTRMIYFKYKNIRGQVQSTRSRELINTVHRRALAAVDKYRAARSAKMSICGPGEWENILRPLSNDDVRSYVDPERQKYGPGRRGIWEDGHEPEAKVVADQDKRHPNQTLLERKDPNAAVDDQDVEHEDVNASADDPDINKEIQVIPLTRTRKEGTGRTKHTISWIWMKLSKDPDSELIQGLGSQGGDAVDKEADRFSIETEEDDICRAEWARSRARVRRCEEEVKLLKEEMRRLMEFLKWKSEWWDSKKEARQSVNPELQEGLRAYAEKQAGIQRLLSTSFQQIWRTPLCKMDDLGYEKPLAKDGGSIDGDDDNDNDNDDENDDNKIRESGCQRGYRGNDCAEIGTLLPEERSVERTTESKPCQGVRALAPVSLSSHFTQPICPSSSIQPPFQVNDIFM